MIVARNILLFVLVTLICIRPLYGGYDSVELLEAERLYNEGTPIPEEYVTLGFTLENLIDYTSTTEIQNEVSLKGGTTFSILQGIRSSRDYTQLENLRKFADLTEKQSLKYRYPDTYLHFKSLDWGSRYSVATKIVIADLEKAKAEDEAAGRSTKSRNAVVISEDGQDGNPRTKEKAADSDANQKSSQIQPLWWLLAPLLLLILLAWRIVIRKKTAK